MATIASLPSSTGRKKQIMTVKYDFSDATGAAGDYLSDKYLPKGALVTGVTTNVTTNFTSDGSATLALAIGSVAIKSATAFNDNAFKGVDSQFSTPTLLSADSQVRLTVATAAVTAGVMDIYIEYFL